MKKFIFSVISFIAAASLLLSSPQKVVFDTDMGNDIDDVLALLMLLNYHKQGKIDLLGIAVNKDNKYAAPFVNIVNDFYGCPSIPLGMVKEGVMPKDGNYARQVFEDKNPDGTFKYARRLDDGKTLPDAVKFLRKLLSEQKDGETVYVSVGFFTNLANLLKSSPDEISSLSGRELVAKKVKYISAMAGDFSEEALKNPKSAKPEYNVRCDLPSSKYVFENCPVPIIFSGFEIGNEVCYPHSSIRKDFKFLPANPAVDAYENYSKNIPSVKKGGFHNRPSWDLTSVLVAVEPEYFKLSGKGTVSSDDKGVTSFKPDPEGLHQYILALSKEDADKILNRLIDLCTSLRP